MWVSEWIVSICVITGIFLSLQIFTWRLLTSLALLFRSSFRGVIKNIVMLLVFLFSETTRSITDRSHISYFLLDMIVHALPFNWTKWPYFHNMFTVNCFCYKKTIFMFYSAVPKNKDICFLSFRFDLF